MKHRGAPSRNEFATVTSRHSGYSCAQVDQYFSELAEDYEALRSGRPRPGGATSESIRAMSFDAQAGGYLPADVDAALDRVEDRFSEFERRAYYSSVDRNEWETQLEAEAALIMGRLDRAAGKRFRRPSHKLTKGYYVRDVDALCDRLVEMFRSQHALDPGVIRSAVFRSATTDMCYEETQVDAFLDRCLKLILDLK